MDSTWIAWTSAVVAAASAGGALASLVVTVREGRALRRNTEFLAHRDQWWKRWSWVAERAVSDDESAQAAASIMATALQGRRWTTDDDRYMYDAVRDRFPDTVTQEENRDLETE
ncbi:hypothetical protein [Curtobacterium sp. 9128]|uniref:hypothetical protein n=1 Tax=Curtobacterium sp. 9128 TaxID=1793722 RepID=UPI0011A7402E|nr:hypothetical protein [Curtobacterium sp. 9128]